MRTVIRFGALGLVIATALGAWWLHAAGATAALAIRPNVEVRGATLEQLELARWAVRRFEAAGLQPPSVEIEFHGDPVGCRGHLGLAGLGRVDVCTTLINAMTRRALLHEMSHIWLDQHASESTRSRFLQLRGLQSWNSYEDPWSLRGYEQGAELISWALGERILTAQIPDNDPAHLARGFELLTGLTIPRFGVPDPGATLAQGSTRPSSKGGE